MGKIDELIEEIESQEWSDENTRAAVDLSDVKRWVRYALEAVKEDLATHTKLPQSGSNKLGEKK